MRLWFGICKDQDPAPAEMSVDTSSTNVSSPPPPSSDRLTLLIPLLLLETIQLLDHLTSTAGTPTPRAFALTKFRRGTLPL